MARWGNPLIPEGLKLSGSMSERIRNSFRLAALIDCFLKLPNLDTHIKQRDMQKGWLGTMPVAAPRTPMGVIEMQNLVIKLNQPHWGVDRQTGTVFQKEGFLLELPFSSKNKHYVPSMLLQTLIQQIPAHIKTWFEWEMQKIGQPNQRWAETKVTIPYSWLR